MALETLFKCDHNKANIQSNDIVVVLYRRNITFKSTMMTC